MAPNIVQDELWRPVSCADIVAVTTNGSIRKGGTLVMGRGAALQAARRYPGVERECARAIQSSREAARANNSVWVYGFLVVRRPAHRQPGLGIFQVKGEYRTFAAWMEQADLSLVALSVAGLNEYARQHPGLAIRMNYPGIGNGGLRRDAVEPLLACLPENVTICYQ